MENESGMPKRITKAAEINIRMMLSSVEFDAGSLEKIKNLKKPVIFALTHLSDWDITAFIFALGNKTDIKAKIVQASSHNWKDDPLGAVRTAVAGSDNFLTISYGSGKDKGIGQFRRDDYVPMVSAIENGYSIIIAAYHDRKEVGFNQKGVTLPKKGGGGMVYLAKKSGAPIVPVAVNMGPKWRDRAVITVGQEIYINENEGLRIGSDRVMSALAEMLPEEKQGLW